MKHKFDFVVTFEDGEEDTFQIKAETGVQAWVSCINKFTIPFNTGAVVAVTCKVDSQDD